MTDKALDIAADMYEELIGSNGHQNWKRYWMQKAGEK
jgi:hypothetical protein